MLTNVAELFYRDLLAFLAAHFPYISPFWTYLVEGLGVIAICMVVAWFFSFMRAPMGLVVVTIIALLTGYRKGELDDAKHDERKRS